MKNGIHERLFHRELGGPRRNCSVKAIYGDKTWVKDLDIINELEGHSGCVNALSWSKSGRYLASGSDDTHVNIHHYMSEETTNPFSLATSVSTGHSANIFSVKFMPHSNDRTLVTAAGDSQIRVFDIEYSAGSSLPASADARSSRRAQGLIHRGVQYLTAGDTNARIYRSHSDRVKRIVTESSPHLFLSCSEDGEVRQWDLRQPSSAYPRARGGRGWSSATQDEDTGVPPPLISYKRHQLDLNTISCSPSQPHYIALGGAHLHAFLHDRRMLGRDKQKERGQSSRVHASSEHDENVMSEATQCVRRFAPNGQSRMKKNSNGHITACKISDANPNEMIASWSGDWIYSFDLVRSPDASEQMNGGRSAMNQALDGRVRGSKDRKRKRAANGSFASQEALTRATSKPRRSPPTELEHDENEEVSLRVRYENGQSERIPLRQPREVQESLAEAAESQMSEAERRSFQIANASVKIRKHMFSLNEARPASEQDPTGHATSFTSVLGFSASVLDDMNSIIRTWRYPVDPDEADILLQTTLRRHRESARRFLQASGTIARLLGGKLRSAGTGQHPMLGQFVQIEPAPNESKILDQSEQFCYDFIKAIVAWLDSGPGALLEQFHCPGSKARFPIQENAPIEAIDDVLIPYLLGLASDRPVPNVDASPFEVDENRILFASERSAVMAFANVLKMPFEDLSSSTSYPESISDGDPTGSINRTQERRTALRFWGLKVARGLLLSAGEGVNHAYIDRAFGGLGKSSASVIDEERRLQRRLSNVDADENDPVVESFDIGRDSSQPRRRRAPRSEQPDGGAEAADEDIGQDEESEEEDSSYVDESEETSGSSSSEDESSDSDEDSENDEAAAFLFRRAFSRSSRDAVNTHIQCTPHHRHYRGHCNVKTVKDVNFYGPNDEYVVSGSDCGNLFIWDRKTSQLLNILEGDGEVVNVAQGHPYEPILAVSGIDHSIKIFGADARARRDARRGVGVKSVDSSSFSSIHYGSRRRPQPAAQRHAAAPRDDDDDDEQMEEDDTGKAGHPSSEPTVPRAARGPDSDPYSSDDSSAPAAPHGLSSRRRLHDEYRITADNDEARQGGNREAFITRGMLAQLAARMRIGHAARVAAGAGNGEGAGAGGDGDAADALEMGIPIVIGGGGVGGGQQIVVGEDCAVSVADEPSSDVTGFVTNEFAR